MSENKSEDSELSDLTWAADRLKKDVAPYGKVNERIRDAARALKWSYSRTRTIWYADERASVKPKELRRITEITGIEYGREEARGVEALISQADALLMGGDPDFHSPFVAALRSLTRALDRARASRTDDRA